jgi:hypothetical protein
VGFITSFLDPLHVLLFHQLGFEKTENDTWKHKKANLAESN